MDANNFQQANLNEFNHCNPETISHVTLIGWYNRLKQSKACKKMIDEKFLPVVWHPTRVWDWSMSKDGKSEIKPFLIDEK